jgi:hypothetical protein
VALWNRSLLGEVRQRLHEMGIRIALGASNCDVLMLMLGEGARLSLAGVALGTPAALAASRMISSMLYGISPRDATVFICVPAGLIVVALAASLPSCPARSRCRSDRRAAPRVIHVCYYHRRCRLARGPGQRLSLMTGINRL